jgi:hypothetical protein
VKNDVFKISTFLDPNFGPYSFPPEERLTVIRRIKTKLSGQSVVSTPSKARTQAMEDKINARTKFYKSYKECTHEIVYDDLDKTIASYTQFVADTNYDDALYFWKIHETKWPNLANLAKKYLGVQATSASVERMFNISGHIFSNKRRRSSVRLFELLVFLKLNEHFLSL